MNLDALKTYNNQFEIAERKNLIAEMLKVLREKENLQQKELAGYLGIKPQTYPAYEIGRNEPPIEVLVRLSKLYELPIDFIVQSGATKDKESAKAIIEQQEKEIQELKKQLIESGNAEGMQEFIKALEKLNKSMKDKV